MHQPVESTFDPNRPLFFGRFNFAKLKKDAYLVSFVPFRGSNMTKVADNLTREQAFNLMDQLNDHLETCRRTVQEAYDSFQWAQENDSSANNQQGHEAAATSTDDVSESSAGTPELSV
jgi:hypothetical protein